MTTAGAELVTREDQDDGYTMFLTHVPHGLAVVTAIFGDSGRVYTYVVDSCSLDEKKGLGMDRVLVADLGEHAKAYHQILARKVARGERLG